MFDISFSELLIIGIVALVVIGPERLPKVARTVGHLLGRAQRYVNDVKSDIQREVELEELRKMKQDMESAAHSIQNSFQQTTDDLRQNLQEPVNKLKQELDDAHAQLNEPKPAQSATIASPDITATPEVAQKTPVSPESESRT